MLDVHILPVGQMHTNCYLVRDTGTNHGIIIDPGDDAEHISETILRLGMTPTMIVATHGHFDHIMAACALRLAFGISFAMHPADRFLVGRMQETARHFLGIPDVDPAPTIDRTLADGFRIAVGTEEVSVIHTPGHTPGSISLYGKTRGILFCGDTVFAEGAVGRTDHQYSSAVDLRRSIRRILNHPLRTKLLCGHGNASTVGEESRYHLQ